MAPSPQDPQDPHLLVVDDDARIRGLLAQYLRRHGFLVTAADSAARARRILSGLAFDLVVLDVMMPGEDGLSLCRDLRARGGALGAVPILLLTARAETDDRIRGLEAGADGHLAKPFDPKELVLRVNAILRRATAPLAGSEPPAAAPAPAPRAIRLGSATFDPERGELVAEGLPATRLTATEADLLRILAAAPGEAVSRSRLVEELARAPGREAPEERAIDVQITRLRRKIEPDPRQPRYLQTVRGAGYRLQPD